MTVYRVAWEIGTGCEPRAEDHPTQVAAEQRVADLRAAGVTRVTWYRAYVEESA